MLLYNRILNFKSENELSKIVVIGKFKAYNN